MNEVIANTPWSMLIVVGVMGAIIWRLIGTNATQSQSMLGTVTDLVKLLGGQPPSGPVIDLTPAPLPKIAPPVQPAIPVTHALPSIAPTKVPAGPFDAAPPWFAWALHEVGQHEDPPNRGPVVQRYIDLAHCGAQGDAWCAIFANAALEASKIPGTRSPSSQSFRSHPEFEVLPGPALGALAVFWRGSKDSGLGHVGFYRGEDATRIWTLGGNEDDMVQIEALPKDSASFGLIGYWWPRSVPQPAIGPVMMPAGAPVHMTAPPAGMTPAPAVAASIATPNGKQTGITATMFGGPKSAYPPFGPIDDSKLGVALPWGFPGERPQVRVTSVRTGSSCICDIVDKGPWNTNDPYWQRGARPQAESGTDMSGRKTNRAGIDLTLAAAKLLSIDGKGLVDWEFVESPLPETPNVT